MTQLMVRYDTWLQEVVKVRQQAAAAAPAASTAAGPGSVQAQVPGQQQQQAQGVAGGAGDVGAAAVQRSGPAAWVPDMPLDAAAVICADADVIKVNIWLGGGL